MASFKLVDQARVALISYIVIWLATFVPTKLDKPRYRIKERVSLTFLMLVPTLLSVYTINCLVTGKCEVYAWINAISVVFFAISVVLKFFV